MGIIDNGPGEINNINDPFNNYDGAIGIETRGQSTQMFPKKSYGFETRDSQGENQDVSLLGMPEENDWILYAPYTDKSLMRNVVTFDMGHRMGNYCTRTQYCEVVINNDYKGIYVLEEKIKKNKNRVDISTLKPDEITGDDLTGGYILSVDKIPSGFSYALDGWKSSPSPSYPNAMPIIFQYYYPKPEDIVNEQRTYIKNYVTTTEKALIASSFKDPSTGYLKYFDAPSFVDFMLLNEISKEVDKYRYSTYLYKQKDSDGGRLFAGPVWDFNLGYGNVDYWAPGVDYSGWVYEMVEPHEYSIMFWWKRLMEDPYFKNLTFTRWTELRQDVLKTDNIVAVIDSIRLYTENARLRNFERWPILGQYVWPNYNWYGNDYADEVAYFQNFLTHRLTWMDGHITGTLLKPAAGISSESNTIRLILYGDYFSHEHLKTTHFQLNDAPSNVYIQSADYVSPYECALTLSADVSTFKEISVTVKNEIVNTYHDIVSNKLATAGISQVVADLPDLRVYSSSDGIHIESLQLSLTPAEVMVRSVSGSLSGKYTIKLQNQNILPSPPASGIYIVTILQSGVVRNYKIVVV